MNIHTKTHRDNSSNSKHPLQNKYLIEFMKQTPFVTTKKIDNEVNEVTYKTPHSEITIKGKTLTTFDEDVLLCVINSPLIYEEVFGENLGFFHISQVDIRKQMNLGVRSHWYKKIRDSIDKLQSTKILIRLRSEDNNSIYEDYFKGTIVQEEQGSSVTLKTNLKEEKKSISYDYKVRVNPYFLKLLSETNSSKYYSIKDRFLLDTIESKSICRYLYQHTNFNVKGTLKESVFNIYNKTNIPFTYRDKEQTKIRYNLLDKQLNNIKKDLEKLNIVLELEERIENKNGEKFKNIYLNFSKKS